MASVSLSIDKVSTKTLGSILPTVGSSAPGAGDLEVRFDVSTHAMTRRDVIQGLENLIVYLESGVAGDPNFPADVPQM